MTQHALQNTSLQIRQPSFPMQSSLVLLFLSLCVLPTFQQQGCDPSAARLDCGKDSLALLECNVKASDVWLHSAHENSLLAMLPAEPITL